MSVKATVTIAFTREDGSVVTHEFSNLAVDTDTLDLSVHEEVPELVRPVPDRVELTRPQFLRVRLDAQILRDPDNPNGPTHTTKVEPPWVSGGPDDV